MDGTFLFHQMQVFAITFATVFLRGFQHKNVIGNHIRAVIVTSYLMAVCDVLFIGLIALRGWSACFAAGTGAAVGMFLSIKLHDRFLKKGVGKSNDVHHADA
jgi:hypothetical protein